MRTSGRAPFGATLALTTALVVALFGLAAPLAHLLIAPTKLPPPFSEQNQDSETLLYVLVLAVLLPGALMIVPRVADRIAHARGPDAFASLSALLTIGLTGLLILVKVSERLPWGGGLAVWAVASALWCALAAIGLAATERREGFPPRSATERAGILWLAALGLLAVLVLCFVKIGSIDLLPLLVGAAVAAAVVIGPFRSVPAARRPWGAIADAAVVILLLLAIPSLDIFTYGTPGAEVDDTIMQFHQNFFLGPANQVLGGGAMLVDTLSQYGVGSIYFLAGAFQVIPIGNASLGLIEGLLSAAMFIAAYAVMRIAGTGRVLAGAAMTVAVITLVYGLQYPLGGLLQHGAIRYGLPAGVLVAAVIDARWPHRAVGARVLGLLTLAIASIWALEAFAYTVLTLVALLGFGTWAREPGARRAWLVRRSAEAVAAVIVAHVSFALITLAATGDLPRWGMYLDTLHAFLVGGVGDLTYDFTPWSAALAIGLIYIASAAAIVLLARSERALVLERRTTMVALTGATAWGIALFSYFVNRSADHIIPYVSLPAVLAGALWLGLLLGPRSPVPATARRAALAAGTALAVLLVAVAWSSAGDRFSQSALAHVVPGGQSLGSALDEIWDPPPLAQGAGPGEDLLERYMPGEERSIVLTSADLSVEVLMATGRINEIPFADPWEESLVPEQHLPALAEAIDELQAGDRMLLDQPATEVFEGYLREPERDALAAPFSQSTLVPSGIATLQEWALKEIGKRFRLERVGRGDEGMSVVELVPR